MLDPELVSLLVCPETRQDVRLARAEEVALLNEAIRGGRMRTVQAQPVAEELEAALIRVDNAVAYAVRDDIPVMLSKEALDLRPHDLSLRAGTAAHV